MFIETICVSTFDCYAFHIQINVTVVLLLFTLQMLAFYALHCWATTSHCWATRLLYLVAQWATTFQSNLASPGALQNNMFLTLKSSITFHIVHLCLLIVIMYMSIQTWKS